MMDRDPGEVARRIGDVVPRAHRWRFERLMRGFGYKALEDRDICWTQLTVLCNSLLGEGRAMEYEWQVEMIDILMGN